MSPIASSGDRQIQVQQRKDRTAERAATRPHAARAAGSPKSKGKITGQRKIVSHLLPGFSRQMSAMLSAGMPILAALDTLQEQTDHPGFKAVLTHVRASIENGSSLSEGLRQFPTIFGDLYCNMVKGGESSGKLAETIGRLASFLEDNAKLRRKVKSAMIYPTVVLCLAVAIAIGMILFIVPVFGDLFADFGATLPGPTLFLLRLSKFGQRFGLYIVAAAVGSGVVFKKWKATPAGAYSMDQLKLRLPVFGELNRKVASARFARTLGQMIRSGVPILNALEIVSGAVGNAVASRIVMAARTTVENGEPLASALLDQRVFPLMLVRMVQAGEKTGKVEEMMDNIADFYEDEIETTLAGLTSLLEPILIVFLGVLIGGIVLCMFLPIFKMSEVVSR